MPCIEPHCHIQCYRTYGSDDEKDKIIHKKSLTKIQQEHLMIDLGEDIIVQKLINTIPPWKLCSYQQLSNISVKFYPILFGFIDRYFIKTRSRQVFIHNQIKTVERICLPRKTKAFSDLIPGRLETYKFSFENELDYRRIYSAAYFAITKKKGGWDWNRHYEIITSGVIRDKLTIDPKLFDVNHYNLLLHRLLYYAKHRLTTEKIVEYILKVIQYPLVSSQKHSILFVSYYRPNYQNDFILHGFTSIFKENLHVFQPPRYMYQYPLDKMWTDEETKNYFANKLYGLGFGYKLGLKDYLHLYERDVQEMSNQTLIETNIKSKRYSLIVFGSILQQNKFYSLAREYYEQSRLVLIDGEDEGKDIRRKHFLSWGTYFLREIPVPDDCNQIV